MYFILMTSSKRFFIYESTRMSVSPASRPHQPFFIEIIAIFNMQYCFRAVCGIGIVKVFCCEADSDELGDTLSTQRWSSGGASSPMSITISCSLFSWNRVQHLFHSWMPCLLCHVVFCQSVQQLHSRNNHPVNGRIVAGVGKVLIQHQERLLHNAWYFR